MNNDLKVSLKIDADTGKLVGQVRAAADSVESFGDKAAKAGKSASDGMNQGANGAKAASSAFRQLEKELDPSVANTQKLSTATAVLEKEYRSGNITLARHAELIQLANQRYKQATGKLVGQVRAAADSVESFGDKAAKAGKSASDGMNQGANGAKAASSAFRQLEKELDPSVANTQKLSTATAVLEKEYRSGNITLARHAESIQLANQRYKQATGGMRMIKGGAQQLGYQIQDMAIQAQMGVSAFTILGQQGPQIASVFGPAGAAFGAIIAIGSAIGGTLVNSIVRANDEIDSFNSTYESLRAETKEAQIREQKLLISQLEQKVKETETAHNVAMMRRNRVVSIWSKIFDSDYEREQKQIEDSTDLANRRKNSYAEMIEAQSALANAEAKLRELMKTDGQRDEDDRLASVREYIAALREEQVTQGMSSVQLAEHRARQMQMTGDEIKLVIELTQQIDEANARQEASAKLKAQALADERVRVGLQRQLVQLSGDEKAARDAVLSTLSKENAELQKQVWAAQDNATQEAAFDKFQKQIDSLNQSTRDYGDTWTRTGNQIVDAMGSVASVLQEVSALESGYAADKQKIDTMRASALSEFGEQSQEYKAIDEELTKRQIKLDEERADNSIRGSIAMLDASVNMFEQGSTVQKRAHQASLVIHAAELAMDIQKAISNMTYTTGKLAADQALAASAATVAVATQGTGDPYTAWPRIAAMSVMMAGLLSQIGASFGGASGSAPDLSVEAQKTQSTGTVFGDASAKSSSAMQAMDFLNDINADQYVELRGINLGVRALNDSITGVTRPLVRDYGSFDGSGMGLDLADVPTDYLVEDIIKKYTPIGWTDSLLGTDIVGSVSRSVFGGGTSKSVTDSGVRFDATTVGNLMAGGALSGDAYATVKSVKDGGWFRSDKTSYSTSYQGMDAGAERMMGLVFRNMADTMLEIGDGLGRDISSQLSTYQIDLGKISLKGMTGEEIEKALGQAISAESDKMVEALLGPIVEPYQKVSEGSLETAVRVVGEKAVVMDILSQTSQSFVGDALAVSQALIKVAGGLDRLRESAQDYFEAFYNEAEQQAFATEKLTQQLAEINKTLPLTREGYRALVEAQNLDTEAGKEAYATLMNLADAANDYYSTLEQAELDLLDARMESVSEQMQALEDLKASLRSTYEGIVGSVVPDAMQMMQAQATLASALAAARLGDLPTDDGLKDTLAVLGRNTPAAYASFADFQRDQMATAAMLDELVGYSDEQISIEASMLEELQAIADSVKAIDMNTYLTAVNYPTFDAWLEANPDMKNNDKAGLAYSANQLAYLQQADPDKWSNFAARDGSYATGLDYVPFDGFMAELHQGEAIIDARTMQGMRKYGLNAGAGDSGVSRELSALRREVAALRNDQAGSQYVIAKNSMKLFDLIDKWDSDGQPEVRS